MQPTASPCRDGLPFFSFVEYNMTAEACLDFCLGKGFDLFGVLSNLECRCGGSAGNEGAWQKKKKRRELLLPLNSIQACSGTEALKVYRYTGHFVAGSVPPMALRMNQSDGWYVGSVRAGRHILPEIDDELFSFRPHAAGRRPAGRQAAGGSQQPALRMGTKIEESTNTSMLQEGELRSCAWGSQCGAGKPWPSRFPSPEHFTSQGNKWEKLVGIHYHFKKPAYQFKKGLFREAALMIMSKTCLIFTEMESGSQVEVDTVGGLWQEDGRRVETPTENSRWVETPTGGGCQLCHLCPLQTGEMSTGVLGYPGEGNKSYLMVGWNGDNRPCNRGSMIHEIGHLLGLPHEHSRPDAYREVSGHGPYIKAYWDVIDQLSNPDQFKTIEDTYVGSADDGPGDPYSGWAPYDFASIMHYPTYNEFTSEYGFENGFFQTIPEGVPVGQRVDLSEGDMLKINDIYQCKRRAD